MKNKYYLFLIIFIIVIFSCKTQQVAYKKYKLGVYWENFKTGIIDTSQYKVSYNYSYMIDTISKRKYSHDLFLKVGKRYSITYSPFVAKFDSLFLLPGGLGRAMDFVNETQKKQKIEIHRDFAKYTYKDKRDNSIFEIDNISNFNFMYKESNPIFQWQILSESKTIIGYKCTKAKCKFRGRTYIAWFTEEIPISEGPWKFSGLPGLILSVYDTKMHYKYIATGFEKDNSSTIKIMRACFNKNHKYYKIDRKTFLNEKMGYGYDWIYMSMRGSKIIDVSPSRRKKLKYDEMERDYR